ncbi:hypothetical protein HCU64_14255 [Methylobacterium sp. C25]|uniref:hypothetical protein n=1 Tax=Methylobacterium sp. C25 TaxID=2721622 RepID=UPI001F2D9F28|nr:hypothetical protein [Methylobacterium sp. C25]MCE4224921.1 hypothetical protein [Methylobacterium sp. C25]
MSDDISALAHLHERLDAASADRDIEVAQEANLILRKAAAAGRLASGNTIADLKRHALEDLRIRSELVYRALLETWASFDPVAGEAAEAERMLLEKLSVAAEARERAIRASGPSMSLGSLPDTVWHDLRVQSTNTKHRLALRLREWRQQMRQPKAEPVGNQTTTVTFSGNNNTIVAGLINSSANIQLDNATRPRLAEALAEVKVALQTSVALPQQDRTDTLELVEDAEAELSRPQPNKKRLASSLKGIAATIQTVGALGDAYGALKSAMALIGIPLP